MPLIDLTLVFLQLLVVREVLCQFEYLRNVYVGLDLVADFIRDGVDESHHFLVGLVMPRDDPHQAQAVHQRGQGLFH